MALQWVTPLWRRHQVNDSAFELPNSVVLTGGDYFMLLLDKLTVQRGGLGNHCHILITLDSPCDRERLASILAEHPLSRWLEGIRLKRKWPCKPKWIWKEKSKPLSLLKINDTQIETRDFSSIAIHPSTEAPIRIALSESRTALLVSWHHCLMDARGGELLVHSLLTGALPAHVEKFFGKIDSVRSLSAEANIARRRAARASQAPIADISPSKCASSGAAKRRTLLFSLSDTEKIDSVAASLDVGLFRSMYCLAATACAFGSVSGERTQDDILVPVPHDLRRKGSFGPAIGNQLSFLFYRLSAQSLNTVNEAVQSLMKQFQSSIESGIHRGFFELLNHCNRIPLWLYSRIVHRPSSGRMASFYFSDVGAGLDPLTELCGVHVLNAQHIPPHVLPPGCTAVFSRYRGTQVVTLIYDEALFSESYMERIEAALRKTLLTGAVYA